MANTTSTQKKSTSKSSSNTSSSSTKRSSTGWGINKISFYTICAVAILYLISAVLGAIGGINLKIISALQGFATAILIIITSTLAWRYVSKKPTVWKVLFLICLLVVVIGIIIPLVV